MGIVLLSLVMLGCLIFSSCMVKPKLLHISNATILGVQDSLMKVEMDFLIYNPTMFAANIYHTDVEAFFDKEKLGDAILEEETILPAGDTVTFHMYMLFELDKLEKQYPLLLEQDSSVFHIKGQNSIGFMGRNIKLNVDEKISVNTHEIILEQIQQTLDKRGNFAIESIRFDQLPSLSTVFLKLKVAMLNDLPMDYTVLQTELAFFTKENTAVPLTNWSLDKPIIMKADSRNVLPVKIELNNRNAFKNFDFGWLLNARIEMLIKGTAKVKIQDHVFVIPINQKKVISVGLPSFFGK